MNKPVSEMNVEELRAELAKYATPVKDNVPRGPIAPPPAMNDPNTAPAVRNHLQEVYAGECMGVPAGMWSADMRAAVRAACRSVIERGW